jgi:NAD dependent epimerase/dehydratase
MSLRGLAGARLLVTGAGGFIGSHVCELAARAGARVRAFVHYNSRNDWGMLDELDPSVLRDVEVIAGDLRDPEAVRRAVGGSTHVLHLGALIGIPYSYVNPADVVQTNVLGTLHVLQAAVEADVERVVQTSTSEVYGTAQTAPMDESHPLNPRSPYAASKVGSDKLAESFGLSYGLPVVVLRPFNTYGPRQSPRAVIPAIITQALAARTVRLGSLTPTRDLTFVTDTARGFLLAATARKAVGRVIQIGTGVETSVRELVLQVESILGRELKVVQEARRRRPAASEVERLVASNKVASELLHWKPLVSLDRGLRTTVEWFAARGERYRHQVYHV